MRFVQARDAHRALVSKGRAPSLTSLHPAHLTFARAGLSCIVWTVTGPQQSCETVLRANSSPCFSLREGENMEEN